MRPAQTCAGSVRRRITLLTLVALLVPQLVGGLAAQRTSTTEAELGLGRGAYTYSSPCSGTVVSGTHQSAQLAVTHRVPFGEDAFYEVRVDGALYLEEQTDDDPSTLDPVFHETLGLRAQAGIGTRWFGFRLGGLVGRNGVVGNVACDQKACVNHVPSYETILIPVGMLRIGAQQVGLRVSMADGVWHTNPLAFQMGLGGRVNVPNGFGDVESIAYLCGVAGERGVSDGFLLALRLRTRRVVAGARVQIGESSTALGLSLGARF